jgi:cytochrome b
VRRIPVWDVPLRMFHWALAALVVFSFVTGTVGGSWLEWHMKSGYTILALLIFRLAWGVMGSDTARFTSFLRGPRSAWVYLQGLRSSEARHAFGHNPLGGWSVVAMLLALLAQAISGLMADDEIATQGPLAVKVSNAVVAKMSALHGYNRWTLVALVALHVAAIAYYQWGRRVDLIGPMVHGSVAIDRDVTPPVQRPAWLAAVVLAIAAAAVYALVVIYPRG